MKNNMNKNKKKNKKNTRKNNNYNNNTTSFYNFLSACLSSSSPAASGNWYCFVFWLSISVVHRTMTAPSGFDFVSCLAHGSLALECLVLRNTRTSTIWGFQSMLSMKSFKNHINVWLKVDLGSPKKPLLTDAFPQFYYIKNLPIFTIIFGKFRTTFSHRRPY